MRRPVLALLGAAALSGCNLAPKYVQPLAPVPATYPPMAGQSGEAAPAIGWERFFGDPKLKAYIAAALANNRDLAAATARIEQAHAQFRIRQSQRLPQLDGNASAARTRAPLGSLGLGDALGNGSITYNQVFCAGGGERVRTGVSGDGCATSAKPRAGNILGRSKRSELFVCRWSVTWPRPIMAFARARKA